LIGCAGGGTGGKIGEDAIPEAAALHAVGREVDRAVNSSICGRILSIMGNNAFERSVSCRNKISTYTAHLMTE
jgi:hypothetical protein